MVKIDHAWLLPKEDLVVHATVLKLYTATGHVLAAELGFPHR